MHSREALAIWMVEIEGSNRVLVFVPVIAVHLAYTLVVLKAGRRAGLSP